MFITFISESEIKKKAEEEKVYGEENAAWVRVTQADLKYIIKEQHEFQTDSVCL